MVAETAPKTEQETSRRPDVPTYVYRPLLGHDIRIINLLPGAFNDDIRIDIFHQHLTTDPRPPNVHRMTRAELQKTLPDGWSVSETTSGRYIFWHQTNDDSTTWTHPVPGFDPLRYEQESDHVYWGYVPRFEALSYVWGSTDKPDTAFVVSSTYQETHARPTHSIAIGANLCLALRHLRYAERERSLWVDAICINQTDMEERKEQVLRMRHIYPLASRVIIWLGPERDQSQVAMRALAHLGSQVQETAGENLIRSPEATEANWWRLKTRLPYDATTRGALNRLFKRDYFGRLWVVQELQLTNRLAVMQIGHDLLPLSLFRSAMARLYVEENLGTGLRRGVGGAWGAVQTATDMTFSQLLRLYRLRQCLDPRDRVYSLLGISPPRFSSTLRPDYGAPVADVYKSVFLSHMAGVRRWELFGCELPIRGLSGGPSWVPDWSMTGADWNYNGLLRQFASGHSLLHFGLPDPDSLIVTGLRCARVSAISEAVVQGQNRLKDLESIRSWQPKDLYDAKYVTGQSLLRAYAATLRHNGFEERFPKPSLYPSLDDWEAHDYDVPLFGRGALPPAGQVDDSSTVGDGWFTMERLCGHTFFTTSEGYIGFAPGAMPDDIVCIILGCNVPVLLRPLADADEKGRYQLVGQAFVYGLQDAIALLGPLPKPWRVKVHHSYGGQSAWRYTYLFYNPITDELTREDPRLEPHPDWERVEQTTPLEQDNPEVCDFFRNKKTGEIVDSDPRMLPEALEARGVKLRTFTIV